MSRHAIFAASLLLAASVAGKDAPQRPRILGIASVELLVSSVESRGPRTKP